MNFAFVASVLFVAVLVPYPAKRVTLNCVLVRAAVFAVALFLAKGFLNVSEGFQEFITSSEQIKNLTIPQLQQRKTQQQAKLGELLLKVQTKVQPIIMAQAQDKSNFDLFNTYNSIMGSIFIIDSVINQKRAGVKTSAPSTATLAPTPSATSVVTATPTALSPAPAVVSASPAPVAA